MEHFGAEERRDLTHCKFSFDCIGQTLSFGHSITNFSNPITLRRGIIPT